jgi:hypothetical protein
MTTQIIRIFGDELSPFVRREANRKSHRAKLCPMCNERRPRCLLRSRARQDRHDRLCTRCFKSLYDRFQASLISR